MCIRDRAYIGLAEYYFSIGDYNSSLVNYEKAIDLQEGNIDVYFGIAMCYNCLLYTSYIL